MHTHHTPHPHPHTHTHTYTHTTPTHPPTHTPLVRAHIEVDGDLDFQESIILSLTQLEKLLPLELTHRLVAEVLQ